MLKFSIVMA